MILTTADAAVTIDPEAGGRIGSVVIAGREILVGREPRPLFWGAYPMAPFCGRLRHGAFDFDGKRWQLPINWRPHAIHGTLVDRAWRVEGPGLLSVELSEPWPFPGRVVQSFVLAPNELTCRLELHAEEPMPATLGWHPWFRRRPLAVGANAAAADADPAGRAATRSLEPGPLELEFVAEQIYRKDDEGIATGELIPARQPPWDDCFIRPLSPPILRWPGFLELTIEADCPAWVVYDEPVDAICVEPQTGPPNAFNIEPQVVTPDRPLVAEMRWQWRALGR